MRFTFYSAVSCAALLAQNTIAIEIEPQTEVDDFAQLEATPVYEEEAGYA